MAGPWKWGGLTAFHGAQGSALTSKCVKIDDFPCCWRLFKCFLNNFNSVWLHVLKENPTRYHAWGRANDSWELGGQQPSISLVIKFLKQSFSLNKNFSPYERCLSLINKREDAPRKWFKGTNNNQLWISISIGEFTVPRDGISWGCGAPSRKIFDSPSIWKTSTCRPTSCFLSAWPLAFFSKLMKNSYLFWKVATRGYSNGAASQSNSGHLRPLGWAPAKLSFLSTPWLHGAPCMRLTASFSQNWWLSWFPLADSG